MDWMLVMTWVFVTILFVLSIGFSLYPILPGALFALAAVIVYGAIEGFSTLPVWLWVLEGVLVALNFLIDNLASALGVKRVGGSRKAIIGSMIGLFVLPFLLGPLGIVLGPVLGAMIGEIIHRKSSTQPGKIVKVGLASLAGFLIGSLVKLTLVMLQIVLFIVTVW